MLMTLGRGGVWNQFLRGYQGINMHSGYHLSDIYSVNIFLSICGSLFHYCLLKTPLQFWFVTCTFFLCELYIFNFNFNISVCVYDCMPNVYSFPWKPDTGAPGARIERGCEPHNECWERKLHPLPKQQSLLTSSLFLQSCYTLWRIINMLKECFLNPES